MKGFLDPGKLIIGAKAWSRVGKESTLLHAGITHSGSTHTSIILLSIPCHIYNKVIQVSHAFQIFLSWIFFFKSVTTLSFSAYLDP